MKYIILTLSIHLIFVMNLFGQTKSIVDYKSVTFKDIQYIEDIKVYNDFIFCLGFSFKTDGSGDYSRLNKYDKNLKLLWSLKIDSTEKNQFDKIGIFENKIFISGVHGKSTNKTLDVSRVLYSISLNGKIFEKINLGKSVIPATNIEYLNNCIWIAYTEPQYIEYAKGGNDICVTACYDLKQKKLRLFKGDLSHVFPQKMLVADSSVFITGNYLKNHSDVVHSQFIYKIKKGKLTEKVIESTKSEYVVNAKTDKNKILVYSVCRGVYGDMEKFIKVSSLGFDLKIIETKKTLLKNIFLADVTFASFSNKEDIWVLATTEKNAMYLKLDNSGVPDQVIDLGPLGINPKLFIVSPGKQIQTIDKELRITKKGQTKYKH